MIYLNIEGAFYMISTLKQPGNKKDVLNVIINVTPYFLRHRLCQTTNV